MTRGSGAAAPAPEVSVLVPIYNVERYLERCLTSLVGQTYDDFEAICINDGSTDGSRAIIQRFLDADPRFRVIDKENSGYGGSMNRGLDAASGRYVAILESDDLYEPDALAVLHEAAEKNSAEVVKANFNLYWSRPEERRELFRVVDTSEEGRTLRPLDDLAVFFRKPSIWSGLYRRDFLTANGIRFLETPGASYQDSGFNFKVWAAAERASFVGAPVLNYRQDNEGSSVNNPGKVFCVCDEYASMEEFVRARGSADERRLLAILQRMKLDSYLWNYDRLAPELRPAFVERAAKEFRAAFKRGEVDLALFEPAAEADLRAMVADPAAFCVERDAAASAGAAGALRRYLRMGGPALVSRVLWFRLFGRSARRIDAQGAAL